jgi:hypothetical protein
VSPRDEPVIYAVGRADLHPGLRVAQVGHALVTVGWTMGREGMSSSWFATTQHRILIVEVPDLDAILRLRGDIEQTGDVPVGWHEPDLDYELTALAGLARHVPRQVSKLPLMFDTTPEEKR